MLDGRTVADSLDECHDDHGGGAVDDEGEQVNEEGHAALLPLLPIYGIDAQGPIKEVLAHRAHFETMGSY